MELENTKGGVKTPAETTDVERFTGYIVGVDAGGPYEIMGDDSETDTSPLAAFDSIIGFWSEVVGDHPKMHVRIFSGDDYVYSWTPKQPYILERMDGTLEPGIQLTVQTRMRLGLPITLDEAEQETARLNRICQRFGLDGSSEFGSLTDAQTRRDMVEAEYVRLKGSEPVPHLVIVEPDLDATDPSDESPFKLVSFNTRHKAFQEPDTISGCRECGDSRLDGYHEGSVEDSVDDILIERHPYVPNPDIVAVLSYYEHGACAWYRFGDASVAGQGSHFDTVHVAGVLLFEDENDQGVTRAFWDNDVENKNEWIDSYLEEYSAWANGYVYIVTVEDRDGEILDSCGGVYDTNDWLKDNGYEDVPVEERW